MLMALPSPYGKSNFVGTGPCPALASAPVLATLPLAPARAQPLPWPQPGRSLALGLALGLGGRGRCQAAAWRQPDFSSTSGRSKVKELAACLDAL